MNNADSYQITFIHPDGSSYLSTITGNQHILDIALAEGQDLPYSCLQGWCLSCAARILSGTVNQEDSHRFFEADRKDGFALLCTGKPESDLIIKTHQSEEMKLSRKKNKLPYSKGKWGINKLV